MKLLSVSVALALATATTFAALTATASAQDTKPVIVLVHGAFADGSGWSHVIPLLEKDGYTVIAVQNPLKSIEDDVATTKRVIDAQKGPVVVVGHSYGGVVITGAAADSPNVKALVYIAAYAPDVSEKLGELSDKFAPTALPKELTPDAAGFLYVNRSKFHELFCADVPVGEASIMAATQKPLQSAIFGEAVSVAAWKTIPSFYLVSQEDKIINPELERFMAKRIGATTSEVKSSHVSFISQPKVVVDLIEKAAKTTVK